MLRRIQHLPQRTALPVVYGLVGQFPIEFELHRRQFTLFGNIIREDCIEKNLAFRQLAVKDDNSHSWFIIIKKYLYKYGLPSPYELLENPPSKYVWKKAVNGKLVEYWKERLASETLKKTSLKFWNPNNIEYNVCSQIWARAGRDTVSVHKANIHVKLLSGTYILQKNKARFNQYEVSSLCPLCGIEPEDLVHFMLTCEKLEEVRQPFITNLQKLITFHHGSHWWTQLGDRDRVQLILDNTKLTEINEPARMQIWDISRGLCYILHSKRSAILDTLTK